MHESPVNYIQDVAKIATLNYDADRASDQQQFKTFCNEFNEYFLGILFGMLMHTRVFTKPRVFSAHMVYIRICFNWLRISFKTGLSQRLLAAQAVSCKFKVKFCFVVDNKLRGVDCFLS